MGKQEVERAPVVVIMGHVDHGKSSILEAVKDIKITGSESGGITQHIGAYSIEHQSKKITFLDTPGHEAFSTMRSRGARVADIAVLVVAADDGVKAQTKEAIEHIQKAELPMIIAINKIDKPEADVNRVAQELAESGIFLESIGGKTPSVSVSAKTKENLNELLEMILLVAEMEELRADPTLPAKGLIVESELDPLKGPMATAIIEDGTLRVGDVIATRTACGRVKSLTDFQGSSIDEAPPSTPTTIYGFNLLPSISDEFQVFDSMKEANEFTKEECLKREEKPIIKGEEVVNAIIKADFLGSLEALEGMISAIPQERVSLNIVKADVGEISESDIQLAKSSESIIFGFRVKTPQRIEMMAERDGVKIIIYDVIYELIEKIREVMERAIVSKIERVDLGQSKVLVLFFHEKNHQIVGCKVIQGEIKDHSEVEVLRVSQETGEEEQVGKGRVKEVKIGSRKVESVSSGEECGISYEGDVKIEEGDLLRFYIMREEEILGL